MKYLVVKRHDVCKLLSRGLGRMDRKRETDRDRNRERREGRSGRERRDK